MVPLYVQQAAQDWQIKPLLEVRERYETRIDKDFDSAVPDRRTDLFSRVRPGVEIRYSKNWKAQLVYQYAHDWAWTPGRNFSTENSDLLYANAQFESRDFKLVAGRQRIVLGSERLIGTGEWGNRGRSWDGVYASGKDWEAMASKIGVNATRVRDTRVAAVSKKWAGGQTMAIYKHDENPAGDDDLFTLDHLYRRAWGPWDFDAELALQGGHTKGLEQRAWAFHAGIGYKRPGSNTRFYAEVNAASGGTSGNVSHTFDQLFASNHKLYGIMDLQGWRNMNSFSLSAEHKVNAKTTVLAGWHYFMLRDPSDAWYSDGGAPNRWSGGVFIDPAGQSGRDVGHEFDLEVVYRPHSRWTLSAGVAVFLPGRYVENITGSRTTQWWGYVQAMFKL